MEHNSTGIIVRVGTTLMEYRKGEEGITTAVEGQSGEGTVGMRLELSVYITADTCLCIR